jgi:hypothetical protein
MTAARVAARTAAVVAVTAALAAALARASAAPLAWHETPSSRLRLSWSARPERIETCRTLSAAELAEREAHMRQRVECDGHAATYALRVTVDGQLVVESVVRGAGLRHDRPLYVLRDLPIDPGAHGVRITFTRRERTDDDAAAFAPAAAPETDTGLFAGRAQREAAEHARRARAAVPASLVLDTTLTFAPRRVRLVTFDAERRTLEVAAPPNR